jgi:hypothetical protein
MKQLLFKKIRIYKWDVALPVLLWVLLAIAASLSEILRGLDSINNYLVFKGVFWHSIQHLNLYDYYPKEYHDVYLYGPSFSLVIAPFAWMNTYIGCFFWCMANAAFLLFAVKQLPVNARKQQIILLIGVIEMMTSLHNVQFNPMLTAWIILSFTMVQKEKDFWAALFIAAGLIIKIYGVVGVAFFLFSRHKKSFVFSFIFWFAVLFCLPMLYTSPHFIIESYNDWYDNLFEKNAKNAIAEANNFMQDISVLGMVRKIFNIQQLKNIYVTIPAAIVYALPFLRWKQFSLKGFQLNYLALALIGVVIFSTSAESATYVIAMLGVAIWYIEQPSQSVIVNILLIFALTVTSLSATDFFPEYWRTNFIRPYALKALPCFIIWCTLAYRLIFCNFSAINIADE